MAQAAQASYAELNSGSGGTELRDQLLLQINKGIGFASAQASEFTSNQAVLLKYYPGAAAAYWADDGGPFHKQHHHSNKATT